MAERRIALLTDGEVVRVEPGLLICAGGQSIEFDEALWVTEAAAAPESLSAALGVDLAAYLRARQSRVTSLVRSAGQAHRASREGRAAPELRC